MRKKKLLRNAKETTSRQHETFSGTRELSHTSCGSIPLDLIITTLIIIPLFVYTFINLDICETHLSFSTC